MNKFFKLDENGTTVRREISAGVATFFAMSYILFVNPQVLGSTGMPVQAVFMATVLASMLGTVIMGLVANVPYALAPGMGLNAFFAYTVVLTMGYSWQEGLAMVFICGLVNALITFTNIRKAIILGIPESLQHAIGGGIGIFIAYIGIKNTGLLQFVADPGTYIESNGTIIANSAIIPELVKFNNPAVLVGLAGLVFTIFFVLRKIKAGILLSILATTVLAIVTGVVKVDFSTLFAENNIAVAFSQLDETFMAAFGPHGMQSLFGDSSRLIEVSMTILAFSLSDIFDTIGTFIGTGRATGIFTDKDIEEMEHSSGFSSKMDRALLADVIATPVGAIFGTSNTTVFVESAAGIGAGGRTGLTSLSTAAMFALSTIFLPLLAIVPSQATAPILIVVGMMMMGSFKFIKWEELSEAIPAFFASVFMGFAYSISYGIAAGFITFIVVKIIQGKIREVKPVLWIVAGLFLLNFTIMAIL